MITFHVRLERKINNIISSIVVHVRAENRDEAAFLAEDQLGKSWNTLQVLN